MKYGIIEQVFSRAAIKYKRGYLIRQFDFQGCIQLDLHFAGQINVHNVLAIVTNIKLFVRPHVDAIVTLLGFADDAWTTEPKTNIN